MKTLNYENNTAFYSALAAALKSGERIVLVTPFRSMDEVPQRLKDIFELENGGDRSWVNAASGVFVAGTLASQATAVPMNYRPVVVLASTAVGAGVGAGVGAIAGGVGAAPGAGAGALIGLAAGVLAASQMEGAHETEVEIDKEGRLKFHIKPAK